MHAVLLLKLGQSSILRLSICPVEHKECHLKQSVMQSTVIDPNSTL